jgi:hypothetical protein
MATVAGSPSSNVAFVVHRAEVLASSSSCSTSRPRRRHARVLVVARAVRRACNMSPYLASSRRRREVSLAYSLARNSHVVRATARKSLDTRFNKVISPCRLG